MTAKVRQLVIGAGMKPRSEDSCFSLRSVNKKALAEESELRVMCGRECGWRHLSSLNSVQLGLSNEKNVNDGYCFPAFSQAPPQAV